MKIRYLIGDATLPVKKPAVIAHVCNDKKMWGRGFVLALRDRYPEAEKAYKKWFREGPKFELGYVQHVQVKKDITIANMIAQHDIRWQGNRPPIRYEALRKCLSSVYHRAEAMKVTVHMPRIGCVLAGGSWNEIEPIIQETMTVDTFVYTLANQTDHWDDIYETWEE